jgi:hypothetical protein
MSAIQAHQGDHMSLSDLAALGSFVSGAAVLVSLIFLYFQLRQIGAQMTQADKNQRALMSQGAINRSVGLNCWITDNSALFVKAGTHADQLTEAEVFAVSGIVRNILLSFQDYHVQHQLGLADEITYKNAEMSVRFFLSYPFFRALYKMRRATYAPELAALVDRMAQTVSAQPPAPMAAQLMAALAQSHATDIP